MCPRASYLTSLGLSFLHLKRVNNLTDFIRLLGGLIIPLLVQRLAHSRNSVNGGYCPHPKNCTCYDRPFHFITFLRNYEGQDSYAHFKGRETEGPELPRTEQDSQLKMGWEPRAADSHLITLPGGRPQFVCLQSVNSQELKTKTGLWIRQHTPTG
jgi:hypothetical protein